MAGRLQGKVAIVTGGGRGIGRGVALLMAREGARVVVADIGASLDGRGMTENVADQTVREIRAAGGEAMADTGDVSKWSDAEALVGKAINTWGNLDIVVTPHGILRERMVFNMLEEEWDDVIRVHLKGTFAVTHFASIHWRQRARTMDGQAPRPARLITFTSDAGIDGSPGQPNYAAAKAGLIGFTRSCANALARYGVTANAISPQAATRMTDETAQGVDFRKRTGQLYSEANQGKAADPANVAPLVAYLASDEAGYISGRVFGAKGWRYSLYSEMDEERHLWSTGPWDVDRLFAEFRQTLGNGLSLADLRRADARGVAAGDRRQSGTA